MTLNHLHLVLNHIPVLGTAFGLGLLAYGIWQRSTELKKTALGVFVLVALMTIPVDLTGEPAEEGVEGLPGVSESIIEQHEEAAGVAFASIGVLGLIALIGLLALRHGKSRSSLVRSPDGDCLIHRERLDGMDGQHGRPNPTHRNQARRYQTDCRQQRPRLVPSAWTKPLLRSFQCSGSENRR